MEIYDTDCRNCKYSENLYHFHDGAWRELHKNLGVYCRYQQYNLDGSIRTPVRNSYELDERCGYYTVRGSDEL